MLKDVRICSPSSSQSHIIIFLFFGMKRGFLGDGKRGRKKRERRGGSFILFFLAPLIKKKLEKNDKKVSQIIFERDGLKLPLLFLLPSLPTAKKLGPLFSHSKMEMREKKEREIATTTSSFPTFSPSIKL